MADGSNGTRTFKHALFAIRKAYSTSRSWRKVGAQFGITAGMAHRIAHGYEPKDAHVRSVLNMPAMVEVAPCSKCGGNHGMKKCPGGNGKPRNRRAISFDNPESAAITILSHAPDGYIPRLVELLSIERIEL